MQSIQKSYYLVLIGKRSKGFTNLSRRQISFLTNPRNASNKSRRSIVLKNSPIFTQQTNSQHTNTSSKPLKNLAIYVFSSIVGLGAGIATGYSLLSNEDEMNYLKNGKFVEKKKVENSEYKDFPFKIILYQYHSCAYCSQIRTYLDYFGFNYTLVEVDSYSKNALQKFTKARQLPILVLKDRNAKSQWHLTNATAILSAFESLRNVEPSQYEIILTKYLPTLIGNRLHYSINPFKYFVHNSDLNSVEWRRWINNKAAPAFKLNSIKSMKNVFETFDSYSSASEWKSRYPTWKYIYVYYVNALKTSAMYNELMHKFDSTLKPEQILDDVISQWEIGLGERAFISKTNEPNLADLAMFGTVISYDGLSFIDESLKKHSKFNTWYQNMKQQVVNGHKSTKLIKTQEAQSMNKKEVNTAETQTDSSIKEVEIQLRNIMQKNEDNIHVDKPENDNINKMTGLKEIDSKANLRVLTINYLVHVIAFTFAAWSGR